MSRYLCGLALMALTVSLVPPLSAQELISENVALDSGQLNRINLTLRVLKTSPLLPKLPLLVEVTVSNPSTREMVIPRPTLSERDNPYNTLDLFYTRNKGPLQRIQFVTPTFTPWKEGMIPERPQLLHLRPGQSWSARIPLSYDWQGDNPRLIIDAGSLSLRARLCAIQRNSRGKWGVQRTRGKTSSLVPVKIPKPVGDNAAALQTLISVKRAWLLCAPQAAKYVAQGDEFTLFEKLATRYPRSVYASYSKAVLAFMYASGSLSGVNPTRPPDPTSATRLLDEALSNPRFILREEAEELKRLCAQG